MLEQNTIGTCLGSVTARRALQSTNMTCSRRGSPIQPRVLQDHLQVRPPGRLLSFVRTIPVSLFLPPPLPTPSLSACLSRFLSRSLSRSLSRMCSPTPVSHCFFSFSHVSRGQPHPSRAAKKRHAKPGWTQPEGSHPNIHRPKPPFSADGPGMAPQLQRRPIWTRSSPTVPRTPTWLFSQPDEDGNQNENHGAQIQDSFRRGKKRASNPPLQERASRTKHRPTDGTGDGMRWDGIGTAKREKPCPSAHETSGRELETRLIWHPCAHQETIKT